ncbi:hypothetical protein U9M48_035837 [Paspalum notatum var. saurae]|uniref:Uncharacterized protein n=1 Tax=Paspalum notatum var. saurae TaxID=547442 RepID=A0AAQ3X8U0_PASNO
MPSCAPWRMCLTAAPAVRDVKDTMEGTPINADMGRVPRCPPSSPIDVVPIVADEFFMAAPNSQSMRKLWLSLCSLPLLHSNARVIALAMPVVAAIKTAMQHSLTLAFYIDLEGLRVTPLAKLFALRIDVCEQQQEYFEEGMYNVNTT